MHVCALYGQHCERYRGGGGADRQSKAHYGCRRRRRTHSHYTHSHSQTLARVERSDPFRVRARFERLDCTINVTENLHSLAAIARGSRLTAAPRCADSSDHLSADEHAAHARVRSELVLAHSHSHTHTRTRADDRTDGRTDGGANARLQLLYLLIMSTRRSGKCAKTPHTHTHEGACTHSQSHMDIKCVLVWECVSVCVHDKSTFPIRYVAVVVAFVAGTSGSRRGDCCAPRFVTTGARQPAPAHAYHQLIQH